MALHRVYLVPGFFGFANLGDLRYWGPPHAWLQRVLREQGVDAALHVVPSPPTASLRTRAHALLDAIVATAGPQDALHVVGHSSGALDARLLVTPGVSLPDGESGEPFASQVRTVVSVATPHRGTPSAEFFSSLYGKGLLRLLSVATVFALRRGHLPLALVLRLVDLWRRSVALVPGQHEPAIDDQLFDALLSEFSEDRRAAVQAFFAEVGSDQGLLSQITADGMDLFDAAAPDRPGVRYGCVLTRGRRPSLFDPLSAGLTPQGQAMTALYGSAWLLASRMDATRFPPPEPAQREALERAYGALPEPSDNDGMVPTLSQVHGTVIRAVDADHLDVLGHYPDPEADPPRYDWVTSGSGFRRAHFEATWTDVADFLLGESEP